jgi:hypothetical protein
MMTIKTPFPQKKALAKQKNKTTTEMNLTTMLMNEKANYYEAIVQ